MSEEPSRSHHIQSFSHIEYSAMSNANPPDVKKKDRFWENKQQREILNEL